MEFIPMKVSQNLSLKVIDYLERNIRKQSDCKRSSSTKQMNRLKNVRIKICK